jgi:electron transport complex protein RnfC
MGKIRGIHPPQNKNTESGKLHVLPTPEEVFIPMKMHSGKPAIPIVKVGDEVKVGQLIGEMGGTVSAPIHSSVSGVVKHIEDRDPITGQEAITLTIKADGKQTWEESIAPHNVTSREVYYNHVRESGAVGLGGAGYPAAPKLAIKNLDTLDYILLNAAECEPYVTADDYTMLVDTRHVEHGVELLLKFMPPREKVLICIEDNKPDAINVMRETFKNEKKVEVVAMPTFYPQGERKVLVYNTTGRIVPEGARLADVGVIVTNITTIAVIARYIETGLPLVKKLVTVDGPLVKHPKNVLAPIGTPLRVLFDYCGGFIDDVEPSKIIVGGPMMGYAQPSIDVPVVKTTNSALAFPRIEIKNLKQTACIKCSRCITICPMRLMPPNIEAAFIHKNYEKLKNYKTTMCVECGSCAYVCPAKRPLVQTMQFSKKLLWMNK